MKVIKIYGVHADGQKEKEKGRGKNRFISRRSMHRGTDKQANREQVSLRKNARLEGPHWQKAQMAQHHIDSPVEVGAVATGPCPLAKPVSSACTHVKSLPKSASLPRSHRGGEVRKAGEH